MSNENTAGALILSNIKIFNEAAALYIEIIEPKILNGINECFQNLSTGKSWEGKFKLETNGEIWLRPKKWKEGALEAWFEIGNTDDKEDNYWIPLLCNQAINDRQAGFFFDANPDIFGGKIKWKNHIKNTPEDLKRRLKEIGFELVKDRFFLPVQLSHEALSESWLNNASFTHQDGCFAPLHEAFTKLEESVSVFDNIMDNSRSSQGS